MSIFIKRRVQLNLADLQELELYFAAATVRKKLGESMPELHTYLNSLEDYVNGAIIQCQRIRVARKSSLALMLERHRDPFNVSERAFDSWFIYLKLQLLEIHFYVICIDKIHKLYPRIFRGLSRLANTTNNVDEIREKKAFAESQFRKILGPITGARNYLEHIEEKVTKEFDGFQVETDETGSRFTFGKKDNKVTVDIGNIEQIQHAYEALISYINVLPDAS